MVATNRSIVFGSQITHVSSGNSIAPAGISGTADNSAGTLVGSSNLSRFPLCDVALFVAPTAAVSSASTNVILYRRDLDIDETSDEDAPDASNKNKFMGVFNLKYATASKSYYLQMTDVPLSGGNCEFYIENQIGVNIPAGWTLKVTPKTDSFE